MILLRLLVLTYVLSVISADHFITYTKRHSVFVGESVELFVDVEDLLELHQHDFHHIKGVFSENPSMIWMRDIYPWDMKMITHHDPTCNLSSSTLVPLKNIRFGAFFRLFILQFCLLVLEFCIITKL